MPNKPAPKYRFAAEFCISIRCSAFELSWHGSSENVQSFELRGQVELHVYSEFRPCHTVGMTVDQCG